MDGWRTHETENPAVLTEPNWPVCLQSVHCVHVCVCFVCFPAGFELLYQPEVVRLYLSLLTESQNYNTLEAAAGALQNLSAGQWTVSSFLLSFILSFFLLFPLLFFRFLGNWFQRVCSDSNKRDPLL